MTKKVPRRVFCIEKFSEAIHISQGAVHTHGSLCALLDDMTEAWEWTLNDVILHVLPLHHIHGVVNVLMAPLYNGATCVMMPKFDAKVVGCCVVESVFL